MVSKNIIIHSVILICFSTLLSGCSLFLKKSEIIPAIESDSLTFDFPNKDFNIIYYEINSLEEYQSDGLTYKTILKERDQRDANRLVITRYKDKNILDNHAYYLMIVKTGNIFQTLGFCVNKKSVYIQKNQKNNSEFINNCHNFSSK